MEFKELNQDEKIAIYGGNELTQSLLYYAGVISKGFYYYYTTPFEGGYAVGKCGY